MSKKLYKCNYSKHKNQENIASHRENCPLCGYTNVKENDWENDKKESCKNCDKIMEIVSNVIKADAKKEKNTAIKDLKDAIQLLKKVKPYIEKVNRDAEVEHDSYSYSYIDYGLFEIMIDTEKLTEDIYNTINRIEDIIYKIQDIIDRIERRKLKDINIIHGNEENNE